MLIAVGQRALVDEPAGPQIAVTGSKRLTEVKIVSKEKVKVLAEQNGWSLAHAEGYIEGQRWRRRGLPPSPSNMVGIDDYCLGFRAGYFGQDRKPRTDDTTATK